MKAEQQMSAARLKAENDMATATHEKSIHVLREQKQEETSIRRKLEEERAQLAKRNDDHFKTEEETRAEIQEAQLNAMEAAAVNQKRVEDQSIQGYIADVSEGMDRLDKERQDRDQFKTEEDRRTQQQLLEEQVQGDKRSVEDLKAKLELEKELSKQKDTNAQHIYEEFEARLSHAETQDAKEAKMKNDQDKKAEEEEFLRQYMIQQRYAFS